MTKSASTILSNLILSATGVPGSFLGGQEEALAVSDMPRNAAALPGLIPLNRGR